MLINIKEELQERDRRQSDFYNLFGTYTINSYSIEEKKKLAEALATKKSNSYIFDLLNKDDIEAKTFGNIGESIEKSANILKEDINNDTHYYGLFNYKIGTKPADDRLNLLNVCNAKSLYAAEEKLSPMQSEYVTEIYKADYDNFFKGNYQLLDEGAIWDAIKAGAKSIGQAAKGTIKNKIISTAVGKAAADATKGVKQAVKATRDAKQAAKASSGSTNDELSDLEQLVADGDVDAIKAIQDKVLRALEVADRNKKQNEDDAKKAAEQAKKDKEAKEKADKEAREWAHANGDASADESINGENMIKLRNINEEQEEQSFKVVFTDSQIIRSNSPSGAVSEFKKNHADATNVHIDTSYKPEKEKNESLIEDLNSEELANSGYVATLMDAINDTYESIDNYNVLLLSLKEGCQDSACEIVESIIEDEYNHIGQLQTLLANYSDVSGAIAEGEKEATEQLGTEEDAINDNTMIQLIDDDFGSNNGFDIFM